MQNLLKNYETLDQNDILNILFKFYKKDKLDVIPRVVVQYIKKNRTRNIFSTQNTYPREISITLNQIFPAHHFKKTIGRVPSQIIRYSEQQNLNFNNKVVEELKKYIVSMSGVILRNQNSTQKNKSIATMVQNKAKRQRQQQQQKQQQQKQRNKN